MGSLVAGDLDFAPTGFISAIALMAAGVDRLSIIGTQDSYATVEGIIAKGAIQPVKDLRGKKPAVTFASSAHVLVLDVLKKEGLDPKKDVYLINLKVSEMPAAFESGEVDACAAWTPVFNKLLQMKGIPKKRRRDIAARYIDRVGLMLSSRIVIMTARPGKIARDMPNDLPHPRDASVQLSDTYVTLKREMWDTVQTEVLKSMEVLSG